MCVEIEAELLVFIKACFGYLGIQIVAKSRPFFRGPAVVSGQIMCFWPSFGHSAWQFHEKNTKNIQLLKRMLITQTPVICAIYTNSQFF